MSSDDDFEDPRPTKNRRKSKFDEKESGQSTLTQFDRNLLARDHAFTSDEDDFEVWEEHLPNHDTEDVADSRQARKKRSLPWLLDGALESENAEPIPEIPETSQIAQGPDDGAIIDDMPDQPTTASRFRTPQKVHFREVPSSQTPPSTIGSTKANPNAHDIERSPLKTRSVNVQAQSAPLAPPHLDPESQNISMKTLERVHFATRKVPLNDTLGHRNAIHDPRPIDPPIERVRNVSTESRPTLLTRLSTIQDSQSESAGLSSFDSAEPIMQARRTLKRVSTVQDSQFDDNEILDETEANDDHNSVVDDVHFVEDSQFLDDDDQDETFDPAHSALDRDALRFGRTQTQRHLSDVEEDNYENESDDDDLDRGYMATEANRAPTTSSQQLDALSQDPVEVHLTATRGTGSTLALIKPSRLRQLSRPNSRDDSAYESSDLANPEGIIVLSSSPPPHPSQVSTVVPTQASMADQRPIKKEMLASSPPAVAAALSYDLISPHKPFQHSIVLSSSPVPLPPWNSSNAGSPSSEDDVRTETRGSMKHSQLEKLADFSLPPPPPLSSSRGHTPASSSR